MKRNIKLEKIVKRNEETKTALRKIFAGGGFYISTELRPLTLYERRK